MFSTGVLVRDKNLIPSFYISAPNWSSKATSGRMIIAGPAFSGSGQNIFAFVKVFIGWSTFRKLGGSDLCKRLASAGCNVLNNMVPLQDQVDRVLLRY